MHNLTFPGNSYGLPSSGVRMKKISGVQGYGQNRKGPGQSPLPDAGELSKIRERISDENCKYCIILAYF